MRQEKRRDKARFESYAHLLTWVTKKKKKRRLAAYVKSYRLTGKLDASVMHRHSETPTTS